MSLTVFLAIIFSSLFQAWWNFHLKKVAVDKAVFLAVGWFLLGLALIPLSLFVEGWPKDFGWWPYLATGIIHGSYILVLSKAYDLADISFVFPMARGLSVVLTTALIALMGVYQPSVLGYVGLTIIALGALTLGSVDFRFQRHQKPLLWIALLAVVVASYTVVDSQAAQKVPLLLYIASMNLIASLLVAPFFIKKKKADVLLVLRSYKLQGFVVALAGSAGYLIIIWAYTQAPAPYVAALREISIVMATLLGVYYLRERFYFRKALGIAFILIGVVVIKVI